MYALQKDREQAAFEDWLASECPSGDVTEVQRQWEASTALQNFLEDEASRKLTAWITESGRDCLKQGDGPVRAIPEQCEETGFTVALVEAPRPLWDYEIDRLWLQRPDLHDGELLQQLRDFARAIERAHSITAEGKDS